MTCMTDEQFNHVIKNKEFAIKDELHQHYESLSLKQLETLAKINGLEIGCKCIFLPFGPGLYAAIDVSNTKTSLGSNSDDKNDLESSYMSSKVLNNGGRITKNVVKCKYLLDLQTLNSKTRQILENFEMIVIGRILDMEDKTLSI